MIYQRLRNVAGKFKEKNAIVIMERTITYKRLIEEIDKCSYLLKQAGIHEKKVVAVYSNNNIEYIITLFALAKNKAIAVPIDNIRLTEREKTNIINSMTPHFCINFDEIEYSFTITTLESTTPKAHYEEENRIHSGDASKMITINNRKREEYDGEFTVLYTSGTTGVPKGIVHTQYSRLNMCNHLTDTMDFSDTDNHLCTFVLTSPHSIGICILPALLNGGVLHIIPPERVYPRLVVKYIAEKEITIYTSLPHFFASMMNTNNITGHYFKSIRQILSGGAAITEALARDFTEKFGIRLGNIYGLAEHGPAFINRTDYKDVPYHSIGKPVRGVEVKIVDPRGCILNSDEVGEIQIRSTSRAKGYWNNEGETRKVFLPDGWISTRDLGYTDEHGNYFITGRSSQFINIFSNKVSPDEIESVISSYLGVNDSAVFGIKTDDFNEKIVAYVSTNNMNFDIEGLKDYCKQQLANFKQPKEIILMGSLPRNSYGKVNKEALKEIYLSGKS